MEVLAPVQGMQPRAAIACSAPAAGAAFDVLPLAPVVRAVIGAEEHGVFNGCLDWSIQVECLWRTESWLGNRRKECHGAW